MGNAWTRVASAGAVALLTVAGEAQIPDLLNAFEMGGRSLGMGGALYSNATDVTASYWNPAGLAFIESTEAQLCFRNRPTTDTSLTGTFVDPDREGTSSLGSNAITFGGVAVPTRGGVIGFSYAVGGYAREFAEGRNLSSGDPGDPTTVDPQREFLKVVTEFFTVAMGSHRGAGMNYGVGIVIARQSVNNRFFQRTLNEPGGNEIGITETDVSEAGIGYGGIVGVQFTPSQNANVSFGLSYRTEIQIEKLGSAAPFSDSVPARLQGGVAWRLDGLRGGRDYIIGGIDASYFFPSNSGRILERDGQVSAGFGFEYNWSHNFGYVPVRVGFRTSAKAGENFSQRDVFTFGLGYRPKEGDYWLDLNLAAAGGQSNPDLALSMGFLVGK